MPRSSQQQLCSLAWSTRLPCWPSTAWQMFFKDNGNIVAATDVLHEVAATIEAVDQRQGEATCQMVGWTDLRNTVYDVRTYCEACRAGVAANNVTLSLGTAWQLLHLRHQCACCHPF